MGYEERILEKQLIRMPESKGLKLDGGRNLFTLIRVKQSVGAATLLDHVKH